MFVHMYVHMCIATAGTTKRGETDVQLPSVQNQFLECAVMWARLPCLTDPSFWILTVVWFQLVVLVGVKIPQDGNRTNRYGHVAVVHEHVWRTVCSVCATGARVAQPVPCNS